MKQFNPEEINELIHQRRAIYPEMYTGEVIDKKIIEQLLENANWAPNHKHTEPWRFVVFSGKGLRKLAEFQAEFYKKKAQSEDRFSEGAYEKLLKRPLLCSHIIAIGMKRNADKLPEMEEIAATACAVQNMWLTATAYGLGCYWGTGGPTYYDETKSFFGLGSEDKLMGFLFLGVPQKWPEGRRQPVEDKVMWIENDA
jgi:nitroreductase